MIDVVPGPTPYALAAPVFPFRALAILAGRAPLGGPRETALATLVAARVVSSAVAAAATDHALLLQRAEGTRAWMGSVTLPATARAALLKLVASAGHHDAAAMHAALTRVIEVTAAVLDRSARAELEQLLARFAP